MRSATQKVELEVGELPILPDEWKWGRMEDAATKERNAIVDGFFGSNLKLSDYIDPPGVPVLTTANLRGDYGSERVRYISHTKFQELKRSEVRGGDILVAKIGSCGLTGIYPAHLPSAIIPANLLKMTVHPEFSRKFIFYYLNSPIFSRFLNAIVTATAQPAFNVSKFRRLPIPLVPRDQQDEIVAEIEKQFTRLEAGVAGLQRVRANLKLYRAAVLKAACEGKLVPTEAELARQQGRTLPAPRPGVFFVYAIRCANDSIYIGQTQDLQKRWQEHVAGQAADWTSQHKPVLIVHYEEHLSREEAVAREKWLKTGFGRKWLRREIAAGRTRQAGYETGAQLLERILAERRQRWNGKAKYKEPAVPYTTDLPELPDGWTVASLEQLTSANRVICYGILMPKENVTDGVLYVKVRDMKGDGIDVQSLQRTSRQIAAQYARASLKAGDLLLAIRGTYGRVAEVPPELDGGNITQDSARLAMNAQVDRDYVAWFLRSEDTQNYFKRVARGVAVKGVEYRRR